MATTEKRVADLEYIVGHLPEDLDARFAGVDTKLASIREVQALHTTRFSTLAGQLRDLQADMHARFEAMDAKIDTLARTIDVLPRAVAEALRSPPEG